MLNTNELGDLAALHAAMERGKPAEVGGDGQLILTQDELGAAHILYKTPARMKEIRWEAVTPIDQAVAKAQLPVAIQELCAQTIEYYPGLSEDQPMSKERVVMAEGVKVFLSPEAFAQLQTVAAQAEKQERELMIIFTGSILNVNGQQIYHVDAVQAPFAAYSRVQAGASADQISRVELRGVSGILHAHLAQFHRTIHAAFSGSGDFSAAVENAFVGRVGASKLSHYLTGVVSFNPKAEAKLQIGVYVFNAKAGSSQTPQGEIPGRIEKLPGVFYEYGEKLCFHQTQVFTANHPHGLQYDLQVAQLQADGSYILEDDWSEQANLAPPQTRSASVAGVSPTATSASRRSTTLGATDEQGLTAPAEDSSPFDPDSFWSTPPPTRRPNEVFGGEKRRDDESGGNWFTRLFSNKRGSRGADQAGDSNTTGRKGRYPS